MGFDWDTALCNQARGGDTESARQIIQEFSNYNAKQSGGHSPAMLTYLAECMGKWLKADLAPREASKSFNVARPKNRPSISKEERQRRVKALRVYHLAIGEGTTKKEACKRAGEEIFTAPSTVLGWVTAKVPEYIVAILTLTKTEQQLAFHPPSKKYAPRAHTVRGK